MGIEQVGSDRQPGRLQRVCRLRQRSVGGSLNVKEDLTTTESSQMIVGRQMGVKCTVLLLLDWRLGCVFWNAFYLVGWGVNIE
jgi:hypothetical protein